MYDLILTEYNSAVDQTEEVGGISITFRKSNELNMKITTDKVAFDNILQATNSAWYYVLDTANEGFYLPILNGFLQFGSQAGTYMSAGLPNITGEILSSFCADVEEGALRTAISAGGFNDGNQARRKDITLNASWSNSIYKDNFNTVQPEAVQGYLYFYVGEAIQNPNLVNIPELQNIKLNKDHSNDTKPYITETYVNGTEGYILFSNNFSIQWGRIIGGTYEDYVVNLLLEMADTNYLCSLSLFSLTTPYRNGISGEYYMCWDLTTTSFTTTRYTNNQINTMWVVLGYAA